MFKQTGSVVAGLQRSASLAGLIGVTLLSSATAVLAGSCTSTPSVSLKDLTNFQVAPAAILIDAHDSASLQRRVGDIVAADTDMAPAFVRMSVNASNEDRQAIGQGLGAAAAKCLDVAPLESFAIQSAVFGAQQPEMLASFLTAINDVKTFDVPSSPVGEFAGGGFNQLNNRRVDDAPLGGLPAVATTTSSAIVAATRASTSTSSSTPTLTRSLISADSGTRAVVSKSP